MPMKISLNNFIDRLVKDANNKQNPEHSRLIIHNKKYANVEKSKIPSMSLKKIEAVYSFIARDLKDYENVEVSKETYDKLETLIHLIQQKTKDYKSKHGKIYLFISRLIFGDVEKISKSLVGDLGILRMRYNPNVIPADEEIDFNQPDFIDPFVDDFDNPINLPKKPVKKTKNPNPVQNQNIEDLLNPPIYSPYMPPVEDEFRKLENQIKE